MASLDELQAQVASLPEKDRASLASFILSTLDDGEYDVSDEEVAQRAKELESGQVSPISMKELRDGVFSDLGRK